MSTTWSSASHGIAVGISVTQSPSTVTSSTSSVTLTWTVWARNSPSYITGDYTWSTSGAKSASGSGEGPYLTGGGTGQTWQVTSFTTTLSTSYSGSVSSKLTASLNWPGAPGGSVGTPSVSRTVSVGKRPPSKPSAPTGASVAVGTGDDNKITWTRPSNADNAATKWDSVIVQQSRNLGAWSAATTTSGTATTWTDTSHIANAVYRYRIASKNSSGQSGWVYTSYIATTPAAPTSLIARRSESDIKLTWTDNSPQNTGWDIQDTPDGTTWTTIASPHTAGTPYYTHVAPSTSVTHQYRVRATTTRDSAWSAVSNTVTLISPPAAPTGLGPSVDPLGGTGYSFYWVHNSTDTSPQSAYQLLWSTDGATWTDTGQVASVDSMWDATPALAAAGTVQWQVRTWGVDATPGPYSAIANTVVSSTPTLTITAPGDTVDLSSVEVDWAYAQAEGSPQAEWSVSITDDAGDVVDSATGTDATASWTSGTVLLDASAYLITVNAKSALGLWAEASQAITVAYDAPVAPTVTLDDQVANGYIAVTVATTSNGTDPDAVSLMIERQIDGGDWATLWLDTVTDVTWRDYGCSLVGANTYRVTATSALPSSSQTVVTYQSPTLARLNYVILSTGSGISDVLRFSLATQADLSSGRAVTLNQFAGRTYPVATHGVAITRTLGVTCRLVHVSQADDLEAQRDTIEAVFLGDQPTMYRDTLGRRFWCSLSAVAVPSEFLPEASFTVTQVDPGVGVAEGVTG